MTCGTITEKIASVARAATVLAEAGERDLGEALALFAAQGVPLHVSLGLAPDWFPALQRRRRDALLVELAERDFPAIRGRSQAAAVVAAIAAYGRHGRTHPRHPDGLLAAILAVGEPLGVERVYQLLREARV